MSGRPSRLRSVPARTIQRDRRGSERSSGSNAGAAQAVMAMVGPGGCGQRMAKLALPRRVADASTCGHPYLPSTAVKAGGEGGKRGG